MVIDPTTDLGKLRLRTGDTGDLPYLNDNIYLTTLSDSSGNLNQTARICSMYILAILSKDTRQRLQMVELYGNQAYDQYKSYLTMLYKDPTFNSSCPIPYTGGTVGVTEKSKINTFVENIDKAYVHYNADEHLQQIADINDMASSSASGWTLV